MNCLIGIDLGTSGTKTVLFDEAGKALASAMVEYPLHQPKNGWAEQDPADWWAACISTLRSVLADSGVPAVDIKGIGISGQMHGLVMMDEKGEVIRNSIIWCDNRNIRECNEVTELVGAERLVEISANKALVSYTAGKLLWVRNNELQNYERCRKILLPKDYLRYKLTGEYAAEVSDAAGTNLLDVTKRIWSEEILEKLSINPDWMPIVRESYEIAGHVTTEAAALTGLAAGTPVVGGAGDNAAAAVGTGTVEEGKAFCTIGTSAVIFAHSDKVAIDPQGRVSSFCSAVPGGWTVMSCTMAAGLSLQWLRNQFFKEEMRAAEGLGWDTYRLLDQQAERVPIGANRLLFLPYLMGERCPHLDSNSRGVFFGLSAMHTKYDMLRAVMEAVVYSQRDCLEALASAGVVPTSIIATGGGGTSPFWRQMLADILDLPVITVQNREGPALGAAILAGVGAGLYPNVQAACKKLIHTNPEQLPIAANTAKYMPYYEMYHSLYPNLKSSFAKLAELEV